MTSSYNPGDNFDTPYQKAKQVWDKRLGDARAQASNWRIIAFVLAGTVVLMACGLVFLGSQAKVVPYVVEVGPMGDFQKRGFATEHAYKQNLVLERYFVSNFVQSVRGISSDPVINRQKLESAYDYLTKRSHQMLSEFHQKHDPILEAKEKTRTVDIQTILQISDNTYQADWLEIEYGKEGQRQKAWLMRGVFTLISKPPSTDEEAIANPLGLYVDHFSWQSRETA